MKIFMLGTISGFDDNTFASSEQGCAGGELVVCPNNLSWWRWGNVCPHCGMNAMQDIVPWKKRWREGGENIGDFAGTEVPCWDVLAQKKVIEFFLKNDYFVNTFETVFLEVPSPSLKSRKPHNPIVCTTPYEGPPFWGLRPRYGVHINDEKSCKTRLSSCPVCGHIVYHARYDINESKCEYFWKDFVVDEEEWNGLKLFGVFEFGRLLTSGDGIFLSEEGYNSLIKQGFTNVRCVEVGRIEKLGTAIRKPYRETADYDFWKPDEYVESSIQSKKKR
ncbi:hypothetical protein FACS1894170_11210 [Planctomycetales bacterium]|nr:hypothetical protein FACS1894170_11210 [Planctomycetales bacterium]